MRHDGKFIVNGDIPEGQGSVTALLAECFDLSYELRTDAEREDEPSSDEDDNDGPPGGTKGGPSDHGSKRHKELGGPEDDDDDEGANHRAQRALRDNALISDAGSNVRKMESLSVAAT